VFLFIIIREGGYGMNGNSKCGKCTNKESCAIREKLNAIIREVINKAENEVQQLAPKEIDYMIVTDISVIPIRCKDYLCQDDIREGDPDKPRFFLGQRVAPAAI